MHGNYCKRPYYTYRLIFEFLIYFSPKLTDVSAQGVTASEQDDIEVTCIISAGSYDVISLMYIQDGGIEELVAEFHVNGSDVGVSPKVSDVTRRVNGDNTIFVTSYTNVTCLVAGKYTCRHDNGQAASADVVIDSELYIVISFISFTYLHGQIELLMTHVFSSKDSINHIHLV